MLSFTVWEKPFMRLVIALVLPALLAGCISFDSSSPSPPPPATVVVPSH